jgi:hypothetical protein
MVGRMGKVLLHRRNLILYYDCLGMEFGCYLPLDAYDGISLLALVVFDA